MKKLLKITIGLPFFLLKKFSLVSIVVIFLLISSVFLIQKITMLSSQLVASSAALKATKLQHKAELKKTIAKEKAKARLKQTIIAIPFVGAAAYAAFELSEFQNWKKTNPGKHKGDYACETARASAQVLNEVLSELPENARPNSKVISSLVNICDKENSNSF